MTIQKRADGRIYLISENFPRLVLNLTGIGLWRGPRDSEAPKGLKFGTAHESRLMTNGEMPIVKCQTCADIADQAFESGQDKMGEIATVFLNHVVQNHTGELLGILAERYGPVFLAKREMR